MACCGAAVNDAVHDVLIWHFTAEKHLFTAASLALPDHLAYYCAYSVD